MLAPTLMVQGTASSVGKSLLVTALCRYFADRGVRVAPFKAQNMSLNSAVTPDGFEIGRAQAVQAEAARVPASVEMNPILLKPEGDRRCQVVVLGKPVGKMDAADYHRERRGLEEVIRRCLGTLRERYDLLLIEGAGSPAEVNLKDRDIVNMHVAREADANVLLVGDIDRGGVFAALIGTLDLLEPEERDRVAALVINKFRGDVRLFEAGLDFIRSRTNKPILGVVPHLPELRIADEDSVSLEHRRGRRRRGDRIDIAVVRLPHISNYDDFAPLEHEPGVVVRFVERPLEAEGADLLILPGTKSTALDLEWLRAQGFAEHVAARARERKPVLGVCGGCQMLGERIEDPDGVESDVPAAGGLALLPLKTRFVALKTTAQVRARPTARSFLTSDLPDAHEISGYEIHMGVVARTDGGPGTFEIVVRNGEPVSVADGACNEAGTVAGTMIHGLFHDPELRANVLRKLGVRRGLPAKRPGAGASAEDDYDRLARAFAAAIDEPLLWRLSRLRG